LRRDPAIRRRAHSRTSSSPIPFNIGYKYDKYHDSKASEKYLAWTREWIGQCVRVLKPHGSIYIAIGDEYAAHIKLILEDEHRLTLRNWIIWYYTFGQQTKAKFARAHTHILYFVKDAKRFTFNDDLVRVISDRQKKYNDKRANPAANSPTSVGTSTRETAAPSRSGPVIPARCPRACWRGSFAPARTKATGCSIRLRLGTTPPSPTSSSVVHHPDVSETYVEAARERIAQSVACQWKATVSPTGPHADDELKWLNTEARSRCCTCAKNANFLALFTKKLKQPSPEEEPLQHEAGSLNLGGLYELGSV
jgi:hypothetical protein